MKNALMRSEAGVDKRCSWVNVNDPLLLEYHDREWGVPVHSAPKEIGTDALISGDKPSIGIGLPLMMGCKTLGLVNLRKLHPVSACSGLEHHLLDGDPHPND